MKKGSSLVALLVLLSVGSIVWNWKVHPLDEEEPEILPNPLATPPPTRPRVVFLEGAPWTVPAETRPSGPSELPVEDDRYVEESDGACPAVHPPSNCLLFHEMDPEVDRWQLLARGSTRQAWLWDEEIVWKTLSMDFAPKRYPLTYERHQREAWVLAQGIPSVIRAYGYCGHSAWLERASPEVAYDPVALVKALAEIHERRIVHNDLKPSQLLQTDRGLVLHDFNLVQLCQPFPPQTNKDPRWGAPEELDGSPKVDASVDVFSLGNVLYTMATGQDHPWQLWKMQNPKGVVRNQVLKGNRPSIESVKEELLRRAIEACWVHDRSKRASAQQVLAILQGG